MPGQDALTQRATATILAICLHVELEEFCFVQKDHVMLSKSLELWSTDTLNKYSSAVMGVPGIVATVVCHDCYFILLINQEEAIIIA